MLIFPLRWLLLGLLLVVVVVALWAVWLDRRRARRRAAETFTDAALYAVLERAPFGWVVLESAERYVYANEYARRLLELKAPAGPVPAVEWGFWLDDDRADVRRGRAPEGRYRVLRLPSGRAVRWWLMSGRRWDYLFPNSLPASPTNCAPRWALYSPTWKSSVCLTYPKRPKPNLCNCCGRRPSGWPAWSI